MREVAKYFGILILLLVAYGPLLNGEFVYDGDVYILNNPVVSNSEFFWKYLQSFQLEQLSYVVFRGLHNVGGYNHLYFHLTNLLLHFFNTLILIQIIKKLNLRYSFLMGALFALSPLCVYTAGWIFQIRSTLALGFCLLSFLFYLKSDKSLKFFALSLICFFLSLYAKGLALFFPFMLIGFALVIEKKRRLAELALLSPYFLVFAFFGWMYVRGMGEQVAIIDDFQGVGNIGQRLMLIGQSFWFYTIKILFPFNLKFLYPKPTLELSHFAGWIPLILLIGGVVGLFAFKLGKIRQVAVLFFSAYFLSLLPVLGLFDIGHMKHSLTGNHWAYFASCILILGLAALLTYQRRLPQKWVQKALVIVAAVFLVFSSFEAKRFVSMESFMLAAIDDNPEIYMGYYNLGVDRVRKKRYQESIPHFQKTLEIHKNHPTAHLGLAEAYARIGQRKLAKESLEFAIERSQTPERLMVHLGRVFIESRFFEEAISLYEKYHSQKRGTWKSWTELGIAYAMTQDLEASLEALQRAAALDPENQQVLSNLENTKRALRMKKSSVERN